MRKGIVRLLLGACCLWCVPAMGQWDGGGPSLPGELHSADAYTATLFVFEGSDWCSNCRRMERQVLEDSLFLQTMEAAHIQIERVDFPQRKKLSADVVARNDSLAEHFQFEGIFPTVVIARNSSERFSKAAYHNETAAEYARHILKAAQELGE